MTVNLKETDHLEDREVHGKMIQRPGVHKQGASRDLDNQIVYSTVAPNI